jgi:hypothetical protein
MNGSTGQRSARRSRHQSHGQLDLAHLRRIESGTQRRDDRKLPHRTRLKNSMTNPEITTMLKNLDDATANAHHPNQ